MKRFLVCSVRKGEDEKTKGELLFITMYRLPSKMKDGGLWFPKKDEQLAVACISKDRAPKDYEDLLSLLPGTLVDVTFGFNDFNQQSFVAKVDVVPGSNVFTESDVYK